MSESASSSPPPAVCYRHSDRETRLSCTSCGRPICVECTEPASVGQLCPDCVAERGRQATYTRESLAQLRRRSARATVTILGVCVGIFAVTFLLPFIGLPEPRTVLFELGAQWNPGVADGQLWRLPTSMFLHAGIPHILFNMFALWIFGGELEREVGTPSFLALYAASGLSGGALYFLLDPLGPTPAVGASGAIFGLFGAWIVAMYRNRHTRQGRAGLQQLLLLLGINLALPLFVPNIAWEAHLGGLVAGALITLLWTTTALRARPRARVAVGVGVAVLAIALVAGY
ncbi:rhomboid family intramembrane serine protease [Egibacter rhizosphaerae]|uniref:Rhomboid family intramembrane serine protease n=1 Tax=Egibacter rhizosphaerae TaxID=1670831 RepID=A0A411YAC9_9ACTN|nr:rhomboid family intramembrane serine protease [Egibacter rhizosphaerae]QBI18173.1 rhomboid family intramembrane serine protease [Egibacter rhizosphaerae]